MLNAQCGASGTQLRAPFTIPAGKKVVSASAFASGVGCFSLTLNGAKTDGTSFMVRRFVALAVACSAFCRRRPHAGRAAVNVP